MKNFSKYLDKVVEKALNEALEVKADKIVSEIQKRVETNEKLYGKQSKLDVAEPKGKIDSEDFRLLRKKKHMKEYTMGDDDLETVQPYGDFSTDSPKITPKGKKQVKNVGFDYEKKIGKEFNEERDEFDGRKSKVVGVYSNIKKQRMEENKKDYNDAFLKIGDEPWRNRQDRDYEGDFDFDYEEADIYDYDDLIDRYGANQKWFATDDSDIGEFRMKAGGGRKLFDRYREKHGEPFKLRTRIKNDNEDSDSVDKYFRSPAGFKYGEIVSGKMDEQGETDEGNKFSGELEKARNSGKKSFKVDGKTYPVEESKNNICPKCGMKNCKCNHKEEVSEKWKGDVEVKKTGQYSKMTISQIDDEIKKLKDKNQKKMDKGEKIPESDKTKMSQLYFAKRAKKDWPGKGKTKVAESKNDTYTLTEDEMINLIEMLVREQKTNIDKKKSTAETDLNKVEKTNKKINDSHIQKVVDKMKTYLKDASKGNFSLNPENFPKGNGELGKMDKKAYVGSEAVEEYIENFAYPGMTNLVYDEIKPNDEWIEANIKGSSKTGNAQTDKDGNALGNVVPSKVGEKFAKNYEDNAYGAEQMTASYKRYPQPVDQAGESTEAGNLKSKKGAKKAQNILNQLESVDKEEKILIEEISKMKSLVDYNKKTQ